MNIGRTILSQLPDLWKKYGQAKDLDFTGDLHIYRVRQGKKEVVDKIPEEKICLKIRDVLAKTNLSPYPNMDIVGYPIFQQFRDLQITDYYTLEDRGWETSDFWATIELVAISKKDFEDKISPIFISKQGLS